MTIGVVVPTFGRPRHLQRTLRHLANQAGAPDLKVVVVTDPDELHPDEVERVVQLSDVSARIVVRSAPGVSAARNAGWQSLSSDVIVFLGDDILAAPRLVAEHARWHDRFPAESVGVLGRIEWARELTQTPFMRWLEDGFQFDYAGIEGDDAGWGRLYTSNVSLKRSMLERVDGFDEDFEFGYEDLDLGYRLSRHGFQLKYNRRAVAEHLHEATVEQWQIRMSQVARAERLFIAKHPEIEPHFHNHLAPYADVPAPRAYAARFAGVVSPRIPILGRRVWASANAAFCHALAQPFMRAWRSGRVQEPAPRDESQIGNGPA